MPTEVRLEHQPVKIRQLLEDYRNGVIVIPEFQREYVWGRVKAPRLIDSLYRRFPISTLLLWQSSEEVRARRRKPRPARTTRMSWLIDGQQRVITLLRTRDGDEGIEVVFHPGKEEFKLASAATRKDNRWVRVSDLWDDDTYRDLRRSMAGVPNANKIEARFDQVRSVLDYEVPVVRMIGHSFKDAVDAFGRINTLGVRLKPVDIERARVAARHTGFVSDHVIPFTEKLNTQGFNRLNVTHLFRACAFIARPDGRSRTPLHQLEKGELLKAWRETERATNQALALVRSELGLVNMKILWSGALLVPVIALCATVPPRRRDSKEIAAWLALAALLHRYSGSTETALDQDLKACRKEDAIGALLANLRGVRGREQLKARPQDFVGGLTDRGGLLALYVACLNRGVLDFFTGGKVLLQETVDRHHIFPRGLFPEGIRSSADNIANIAFVASEVNREIWQKAPEIYLPEVKTNILESQCVPTERELWSIAKASSFWERRRELLASSFNDYLRKALVNRRVG